MKLQGNETKTKKHTFTDIKDKCGSMKKIYI